MAFSDLTHQHQHLRSAIGHYNGMGRRTSPSGYIGWRAGTTALCLSRIYPPVRDCEYGYGRIGVMDGYIVAPG
jgi:hypothetical protein